MINPVHRKLAAEAIGTFCVVFAGTTAIVVNGEGAVSHVGVALTFGLAVFAMIASVGDVSGAHLNPAVTVGLSIARRIPARLVVPYVLSQCAGAVLASLVVRCLFPGEIGLGGTAPVGPIYQSWVLELLLTAGLMFVILNVTSGAREKGITAGLAIGAAVGLGALFGGPVSGASMNPARSLGPALVSLQLGSLWLYLTAPFAGAALAVASYRCVRADGAVREGLLATELKNAAEGGSGRCRRR